MAKVKLSEIRAKFPMYNDVPDDQLLIGLHRKYYSDIPFSQFNGGIEYDTGKSDPTEGMSTLDKLQAGFGKAVVDTGRGIGQFVGAVSNDDVKESRKLDSELMNSTAGKVGNFSGNVAMMLPTVAIPGAATLRGAAAIGATQGFLQPSESSSEALRNTALGGAAGAGGVAAGRAIAGAYQGGKALVEPFTSSGRNRIAGRVIQRFADDPAKVAAARGAQTVTGARPTIAEETADAGMARLQDATRSVDPQIAGRIDMRLAENNAARLNKLQELAGADGARDFHVAARGAAADDLYGQARRAGFDPAALTPEAQANIASFQKRIPQEVIDEAKKIAQVKGEEIGDAGSINGLHWMKKGLDSLIKRESGPNGSSDLKAAYTGLKSDLMEGVGKISPKYAEANATYAAMSKPINQMDVAGEFLKRGASSTSDLSGNVRLMPNALTGALKNEAQTVQRATGMAGSLDKVLTPEQNKLLRAIIGEVDNTGAVARAGNGPGSATAQRMASQNVLQRLIGPTGLPTSWAEGALANTVVGKPLNLLYGGVAEPKIQQMLADAVLDPAMARAALQAAQQQGIRLPQNAITKLLTQAMRTTPSTLAVTGQR
jgi:hypothetical protein